MGSTQHWLKDSVLRSGLVIDPAWFLRPDGVDASRSIHGVAHTERVRTHALELADLLGFDPWEREALEYAAIWHDIGRTDDGADYYHGAKSAGKVVGLGLHTEVDPFVLESALFAVTHHCGDEDHALHQARWFFRPRRHAAGVPRTQDADILDRVRLGDLDPAYLYFGQSHERIETAWQLLRDMP